MGQKDPAQRRRDQQKCQRGPSVFTCQDHRDADQAGGRSGQNRQIEGRAPRQRERCAHLTMGRDGSAVH